MFLREVIYMTSSLLVLSLSAGKNRKGMSLPFQEILSLDKGGLNESESSLLPSASSWKVASDAVRKMAPKECVHASVDKTEDRGRAGCGAASAGCGAASAGFGAASAPAGAPPASSAAGAGRGRGRPAGRGTAAPVWGPLRAGAAAVAAAAVGPTAACTAAGPPGASSGVADGAAADGAGGGSPTQLGRGGGKYRRL